jgi:prepilin-type N-terminal cleavage/methylation domain-containing protein
MASFPLHPRLPVRRQRAFSLFEMMISMGLMTIIMTAVLAAFVQTRRLASASVAQSCAVTIVQGYIEQLKNIPLQNFINSDATDPQNNPRLTVSFELPTMKDQATTPITLWTTPSTVTASTLTGGTAGTSPTGAVDNLQAFDMDSRNQTGTGTWATIWPNANNYPTSTPGRSDLRMNFWVQITDLTPSSTPKCKAYGILIVYTWQYTNGGRTSYFKDSVRTVRSAVQTF